MTEIEALKEYRRLSDEYNSWFIHGKTYPADEHAAATKELSAKMSELEPLIKHIKIEIKKPSKIIAARATTAYGGKLDVFDCNDLAHLHLSASKQMGIVKMPYEFDVDGNAYRVDHANEFYVKREDKKVYLVDPLNGNTYTRWYNHIRF